jgi:acyl-CoA synthetase (AMP-forming)/AMP-acid ligase II
MTPAGHGAGARLDALLERAARSKPAREAVVFRGRSSTYAEVHERASRLAGALAKLGVGKGDRVAYWATNRPEFLEFLFGVPKLGAIAAPLDHWWTFADASEAIGQIRPRAVIAAGPQAAELAAHRDRLEAAGIAHCLCLDEPAPGAPFQSYAQVLAAAPASITATPVAPGDPATIFFTSGSTGRSKGAVHTHGSLDAAATIMNIELGLQDGERTLHFLPLFSSCMEHLIPLTLARATHVILPAFDAAGAWAAAEAHGVTHFDAVPTTLRRLLESAPPSIPASLRTVSYASEVMPPAVFAALVERMPKVSFVQFYGMMEQLCLTVLDATEHVRKIATVGRPMLGAEIRILEDEHHEILARSPTLFAGYWEDDEATARVMQDGWLRTGDSGRFDDEGFLVLDGRLKDMIKTGGVTVIPTEIESVLMGHPDVSDAAVVGVPDELWGEAVHAFVTLSKGASTCEQELQSFCRERLAGYKRPKVIHLVAELPRTGIGKIARRIVRDNVLTSQAD